MKDADIRSFLAGYGAAWNDFDVDAIVAHHALPQIVVAEGRTTFLETGEEVEAGIEMLAGLYEDHGVTAIALEVEAVEPLPDHAARAVVRWRLSGAQGNELLAYSAIYTIVEDDDGVLAIVALDADGQVDAHRAAGWS